MSERPRCKGDVCDAAIKDGITCADGECDIADGVRAFPRFECPNCDELLKELKADPNGAALCTLCGRAWLRL